jgi:hypothetical protein
MSHTGVLAAVLILALLFGVSFHAIVPHAHASEAGSAHSHEGGSEETSVVWQALHAALRGEEKNMFVALVPFFALFVLLVRTERRRFISETGSFFAPLSLFEALKRGVLRYRAFT